MKILFALITVLLLIACNNTTKQDEQVVAPDNKDSVDINSPLKPNERLILGKTYTDTVSFIELNDEGDDYLCFVQKNKDTIGLIYNGEYNFVRGDQIAINWKMDSIRYAGDSEFLNYTEFLLSAQIIKPLTLTDKKIKFLWREKQFNQDFKDSFNAIIINETYSKTITDPEKAAIAYVATFVGNECNWDGQATPERTNLKCKILSVLNLGHQCSNTHLNFLQKWFTKDNAVLTELKNCPTTPDGATVQDTFDEITITTKGNDITIDFAVQAINVREGKSWIWTETKQFRFEQNNIRLIQKTKSAVKEEKFLVTGN